MKKNSIRSIVELLKLLKSTLEVSVLNYGLCGYIYDVKNKELISDEEFSILDSYIENERICPDYVTWWNQYYWFQPSNKEPRIKWIEERIKIEEGSKR